MQAQGASRAERHRQVTALKEDGLTFNRIAEVLGVGKSTVTSAYYDPTGEKDRVRRERMAGACVDCGGRTFSGSSIPPERCRACGFRYARDLTERERRGQRHRVKWTDEQILAAVRRNPTVTAYNAAHAIDPSASPTARTVCVRFGSWNEARSAAGLPINHPRGAYAGSLTREGALLAIEDCAYVLGSLPSHAEYTAWARKGGAPSGAHVRAKAGGWLNALREVERRMA